MPILDHDHHCAICGGDLYGRKIGTETCGSSCRAARSRERAAKGEEVPELLRARSAKASAARHAPKRSNKRGPRAGVTVYLPDEKMAGDAATVLLAQAAAGTRLAPLRRRAAGVAAEAINRAIQRKRARQEVGA